MMEHPYTLLRSKRKTLSLEITKDLVVLVRTPVRMPGKEIDRFVEKNGRWIEKHMEQQRRRNACMPTLAQEAQLKKRAREILPQRVAYYSRLMGLVPQGVKITSAKTRFGSCSAKNSLCFSYLLLCYPMEAVDYVVVHELAHIRFKNHKKEFYALIEACMPDYKQRRMLLKNVPIPDPKV